MDDPDTGGHFIASEREEFALRFCDDCDQCLHLPKSYCHNCGSWSTTWRVVRPFGTLDSFTVVEHQVHPAFPVPHTIVLVSLDDVPAARLLGHLDGRVELVIGEEMEAVFGESGPGVIGWRPRVARTDDLPRSSR